MFEKKEKPIMWSEGGVSVSMVESAPCQRLLEVTVSPEAFNPIREAVVKEFRKEASIQGFRRGKAPIAIIEQRHGDAIQQETLQRATQQAFRQAAAANDLRPVGSFEIRRTDYSAQKGLVLEAQVDVEPVFELGEYKGIAIKREPVVVTPEDKAQSLKQLQESMAQMIPSEKKEGEKERRVPPLDDEFAKDMGFENLDKLSDQVEIQLRNQKEQAREESVRAALYKALLERNPFPLPLRLVEQQKDQMKNDLRARLSIQQSDEKKIEEELAKMEAKMRQSAERQVRLSFIMNKIAEVEKIEISEQDLMVQLWMLSQRWQQTPNEVRKTLDKEELWPSVISSIRQEKTTSLLLRQAAIEGEPYPEPPKPSEETAAGLTDAEMAAGDSEEEVAGSST